MNIVGRGCAQDSKRGTEPACPVIDEHWICWQISSSGGNPAKRKVGPHISGDWTATHEFSHLLLPRIGWRQKWISEGFASYYQNVLMARAGRYTPEQAIEMLEQGFGRGRGSRPELSMNEAAREGVRRARYKIYWSGAAIALLADVGLRERSGGSESLDVVLDRFQRCCLPSQRRWSGPELFARFDSLLETPIFMPLYRQYADTPGFPDFESALRSDVVRTRIFAVRTSTH